MEKKGKRIIIAERDNIAVIMDGKKASEFYVHRGEVLLGDVYLATVENILPSIDAAFVDVGIDKMGFLHAQDVMGKGALRDKLSPKQKLVVQVVKEPTGHKGPRVTTEISLPGRFLVLIPNETGVNVSRKIEGVKERARLKSVVNLIKPVGVGVIVRTEAEGQSDADIQEDLEILLEKWNNIVTAADSLTPPNLIYRDQDLLYRVIREACTDDISEILVDTTFALNRVQQLLQNWHMNKNIEVNVYKGTEPLLIATDIHKEIKAALQSKVHLPSGGYLYVQSTEALTVIDVNSGKFVSSATQDETILKTNKEAVHEVARQLRLRNIGGMIIIDFIDMNSRVDKLAILEELEIALEPDKSKPQIGQLSDLGLVELTRHRQGQCLAELFTKRCPHCQGNGYIMDDFKFSSPTAEGEYRAKAAKMKLPMNNFKKNHADNANRESNRENRQQSNDLDVSNGQITQDSALNDAPKRDDNKNRKNKNNRFNKHKNKENQPPLQENQRNEQPAELQTDAIIAPSEAENKTVAQIVQQEPPVQDSVVIEKSESQEQAPEAEVEVKKPRKAPSRRPNRNSSRKVKAPKSETSDEPSTTEE